MIDCLQKNLNLAFRAVRYAAKNPDVYKHARSRRQYDLSMNLIRQANKKYALVFEGDDNIRLVNKII
jgi:hypothetical protein